MGVQIWVDSEETNDVNKLSSELFILKAFLHETIDFCAMLYNFCMMAYNFCLLTRVVNRTNFFNNSVFFRNERFFLF